MLEKQRQEAGDNSQQIQAGTVIINSGIDEKRVCEIVDEKFYKVIAEYSQEARGIAKERISIGVKSFTRGVVHLEDTTMCLSLTDKFNGRNIKDGYDWNIHIYEKLRKFLIENTNAKKSYQISLDTHASLAFAAGRILDSKSGINIFPIQKSSIEGTMLWDVNSSSKDCYPNWNIEHEQLDVNKFDSALILNISRPIYVDVIKYIEGNNLQIGHIVNCTPLENGSTNFAIKDGTHAATLANSIYNAIVQRTTPQRRATLHIFSAAPNAFMFFLGQNSLGFGKCILYEYDFDQRNSCTYSPSIDFTN